MATLQDVRVKRVYCSMNSTLLIPNDKYTGLRSATSSPTPGRMPLRWLPVMRDTCSWSSQSILNASHFHLTFILHPFSIFHTVTLVTTRRLVWLAPTNRIATSTLSLRYGWWLIITWRDDKAVSSRLISGKGEDLLLITLCNFASSQQPATRLMLHSALPSAVL